jgi:hypothetical protein
MTSSLLRWDPSHSSQWHTDTSMQFVYKTWPPKTEGPAEPPSDPEDPNTLSKKHLLKVIQRYHSDKNMTWGDEWRVLSEEVSNSDQ